MYWKEKNEELAISVNAESFTKELSKYASDTDAVFLQKFFKTGHGQYGEGDVFIGVRVPNTRKVCKKYQGMSNSEVKKLLDSPIHEHRLAAVILLSEKAKKATNEELEQVYNLYIDGVYRNRINNWDIIDISARHVVGRYLEDKSRDIIYELARSPKLWEKRVAVLSTFSWIADGDVAVSMDIAEILVQDKEDLIQKAVGWMLREIGKKVDQKLLTDFLDTRAQRMPRTMLRYSLEKLSPNLKKHYMNLYRG